MKLKAISLNATDEAASGSANALRSDASGLPANPFVGLRPFQSSEGLLFFGRREQTVELLQQLHRTRFLAVVGSSGCGKSSLIRAGLIPKVRAGFLVERRDQWRIASMKPGDSPLENLALAICEAFPEGLGNQAVKTLVKSIQASGSQAITGHLVHRMEATDTNLLLLVDQFEEIFRFSLRSDADAPGFDAGEIEKRRDEAADFVSIMLGLARQQALPVYVVMTMRSDFLGDCDAFYGLPEAMNRSQYLVPRLTRQQRQEAIESPIRLYGESISPSLLDRVLNDVGEESDQLPVMQHAMMRTWDKWREEKKGPIDLKHYIAIGTVKDALSRDADRAMEGMSDEERAITERMLQALTKTDARGRRVRRPAHLSELAAVAGASREKAMEIIDRFRSNNRDFLNLSEDRLTGDPLVDISHESLIRQWGTLRDLVDAESESREQYLRLAGDAVRYEKGQVPLLSDPALQIALDWWERRRPNEAWARRYHPEFALAESFLEKSKDKRESDEREAELRRAEQLESAQALASEKTRAARRLLAFSAALLVMTLIAIGTAAYAFNAKRKAEASEARANELKAEAEASRDRIQQQAQDLEAAGKRQAETLDALTEAKKKQDDALIAAEAATLQARRQAARAEGEKARVEATQRANGLFRQAVKYIGAADFESALDTFNKAIEEYRKIGDYDGVAFTHAELGKTLIENPYILSTDPAQEIVRGLDQLKSAVSTYRQQGDLNGSASALVAMGSFYGKPTGLSGLLFPDEESRNNANTQKARNALNNYCSALGDYEKAENLEGQILTLREIGNIVRQGLPPGERKSANWLESFRCNGDLIAANHTDYYERTVPMFEVLIQRKAQANKPVQAQKNAFSSMLIWIGENYSYQQKKELATEYFDRAVNIHRESRDLEKVIAALLDIGLRVSNKEQKITYLEEAAKEAQAYGRAGRHKEEAYVFMKIAITYHYPFLANIDSDQNFYSKALEYYRRALPAYERLGTLKERANLLLNTGKVEIYLKRTEDALAHARSALELSEAQNDLLGQANAYEVIGDAQAALNRPEEAVASLTKVIELYQKINYQFVIPKIQFRIDEIKMKAGRKPPGM